MQVDPGEVEDFRQTLIVCYRTSQ